MRFADIPEDNGKTIYENNMEKEHKLPLGSFVYSTYLGTFLKIAQHIRDCDGTPLYRCEPIFPVVHNLREEDLRVITREDLASLLKG